MTVIRSLIFNAFFFGWTAVLFIVCLPLLAAPRHVLLRAGDLWIGGILGALRVVCGLSYEVRGLENLPDG
ncbi:MAG: 1-acyl-sn-glycerol-3-phosphate acyltransferase, partial [Rhodovibrionaceae bacterium]|nr:1-acyl-sn-glycerol-3-phosphate acyltransferase [Rhodovibrionaceae bacterium]